MFGNLCIFSIESALRLITEYLIEVVYVTLLLRLLMNNPKLINE